MPNMTFVNSLSGGGISIASTAIRSSDAVSGVEISLPVGKAGTLSTRTDANTGVATLESGHGITTGMDVDVYWDGGARYGMDTPSVGATTVNLEGGAGDDLPIATTALVVTPQVAFNTDIDGNALQGFAMQVVLNDPTVTTSAVVQFSGGTETNVFVLTANVAFSADVVGGSTNPFLDLHPTSGTASNGNATHAATLRLIIAQDVTP